MLTEIELQAIVAREKAATEGEWIVAPDGYRIFVGVNTPHLEQIGAVAWNARGRTPQAVANCAFLANSKQDIPRLLSDLSALRRVADKAKEVASLYPQRKMMLKPVVALRAALADLERPTP